MLLKKKQSQHQLKGSNSFVKSWMESPYAIYVTSTSDATVEFAGKSSSGKILVYLLGAAIVLGAAASMILPMILGG